MGFTKNNEEAVSPVIGVILMVAITVILAAVIAASVFGMVGNMGKTKIVAFAVSHPGPGIIVVTNMGGMDVGTLVSADVTGDVNGTVGNTVGSSQSFSTSGGANNVIVTGTFSDGTKQVLLQDFGSSAGGVATATATATPTPPHTTIITAGLPPGYSVSIGDRELSGGKYISQITVSGPAGDSVGMYTCAVDANVLSMATPVTLGNSYAMDISSPGGDTGGSFLTIQISGHVYSPYTWS